MSVTLASHANQTGKAPQTRRHSGPLQTWEQVCVVRLIHLLTQILPVHLILILLGYLRKPLLAPARPLTFVYPITVLLLFCLPCCLTLSPCCSNPHCTNINRCLNINWKGADSDVYGGPRIVSERMHN